MRRFRGSMFWILPVTLLLPLRGLRGQETMAEMKKDAPRVYIDCQECDLDFIRTEITFVNYVWDRKEADVHVLITSEETGGGGQEYTIAFIGQNDCQDYQNQLRYVVGRTATEDEIRRDLTRALKMGLVACAARTPISAEIEVFFREKAEPTDVADRWDFWVFSIGLNGYFDEQKMNNSLSLASNFSANRVTPESKLRFGLSMAYQRSRFDLGEEMISSSSKSRSFSALFVKSVGEHWSVGGAVDIFSSSYRNIRYCLEPKPAVEFNLFPYSLSTRRQLRFLYEVGLAHSRYLEETIYGRKRDNLLNESLSVILELKEPWGTVTTELEGSHYFHDFHKNRVEILGELSLRLFKGLSLNILGRYSRIHDQISLPKGSATIEEILLRRRELETDYGFYGFVSLSYSFGSIYSNVVNPRFGD